MTESEARDALLVRAFESPPAAPWSDADRERASRDAARELGEGAAPERYIARRASIAAGRLAERDAAVRTMSAAAGRHTSAGAWLVLAALVAGLLGDAVGASQRISILAPPLLALIVWNLVVYGLLAMHALRGRASASAAVPGPLRRAAMRAASAALGSLARRAGNTAATPALQRFASDWLSASRGLHAERVACVLHLAALALAAGLLASMFVRGLAFEYRAGWDSTFLGPQAVHRLVGAVFGPASRLSGIALPDEAQLAALRFSLGPGENAARWLYLHAWTVALAVLLPRGALAAAAAWRARRLARQFPLPLDEPYFERLRRDARGEAMAVRVLPYSFALEPAALGRLRGALETELGSAVDARVGETVPIGGEDELQRWLPADGEPATPVALFALSATPERETHGAFVRALAQHGGARATPLVLVDESGYRRRLAGTRELATRLDERRLAWQRMLHDEGAAPVFVDLGADANEAGA